MSDWWDDIEGFSKREFQPADPVINPWDMDVQLVKTLAELRRQAKIETRNPVRFVIRRNGGFALKGHSDTSLHGAYIYDANLEETLIGLAADFTIEEMYGVGKNAWVPSGVIPGVWTPWSWLKQAVFVHSRVIGNVAPFRGGNWFGMGFYPWWHRPGIHLDNRAEQHDRAPAIWFRDPDDKYHSRPPKMFHVLVDEAMRRYYLDTRA